jgi:hypothetical protein
MAGGRPTKLTPELVEQACTLAKQGLPIGMICQQIGISDRSAYRWLKDAEESPDDSLEARFCRAIHESGAKLVKTQLNNLHFQAENGSTQAATWLLTHHPAAREHFSDAAATRREVQAVLLTVVQTIQGSDLTPEQQDHLLLRMQAAGLGAAVG